jgi:2-aminoadipate transaminase
MPPVPDFSQRAKLASGQPVSQLMHQALSNPSLISLAAGFADQSSLPDAEVREAIEQLLSEPAMAHAALQYGTTAGHHPLREQVLDRMLQGDGQTAAEAKLSVDQVLITAGSNQFLYLLSEILLDPSDVVLCAAPTYFVYLGTLDSLGAVAVSVETDNQGMIPEALEAELIRRRLGGEVERVKAIYITSYYDNPSSITLPVERRQRIVEIAQEWNLFVIEDAAYRDLRYEGPDLPSMRSFDTQGDTVIVAQTFSKCFSPGIRLGWGISPPALVEPLGNLKGNIDFGAPNFNQHLMTEVMRRGLLDAHIPHLQQTYRTKQQAMLDAADAYLAPLEGVSYQRPGGGLYVWLTVPPAIDTGLDGTLFHQALQRGMLYVPGQYCYAKQGVPQAANQIRLSFGVQPPERIREGIRLLAEALKSVIEDT